MFKNATFESLCIKGKNNRLERTEEDYVQICLK